MESGGAELPECLTAGTPVGNKSTSSPVPNINPFRHEKKPWRLSRPLPQPLKSAKPQSAVSSDSTPAIWVDGSCFPQSDGALRIGWGLMVKQNGKEVYRAKGRDIPPEAVEHRNVAGEIFGILKALEWCQEQGIAEVRIYFDYQGLESWATGAWRAKLPFTQLYAQTVQTSGVTIHWIKVKAHSGIPENDIVDQLAKEGAMGHETQA